MANVKYTYFDKKENLLCINSKQLLPDTTGMSLKTHCKAYNEAFKLSYEERLEKFACEECRKEVVEELKKHKGCKVTEFTGV